MNRNCLNSVLAAVALTLLLGGRAAADAGTPGSVDPYVWDALARDDAADVLIVLAGQPNLSQAERLPTKEARGAWVYDTLRAAADRSQGQLVAELRRAGAPYRRFWAINAVRATVTASQLARLVALPGVVRVTHDAPFRGLQPQPAGPDVIPASLDAIEWGVNRVQAPWAWSLGYTGQGIVIAGQDSGYDWDHPALINAYRGYTRATGATDHSYNWHDSIHGDIGTPNPNTCGYNSLVPCDDHGHGTHTMGTMVGNDMSPTKTGWPASAKNAIGVAPGARWIGCRNMDNGEGTPSTYIECFEWLIAPYPLGGNSSEGDPAKAPDVINNSWGCLASEGCDAAHLADIEPILNAADAAGIMVVVSAGNSGPSCGTVVDPPAIYPRAWTVGATTSADVLASFSSRGPVTYGGQTYLKPGISAFGDGVRSSVPGTSYSTMSGTSMASPHVAGVTALLLSAQPGLRGQTGLARAIIERTADPITNTTCGGDPAGVPNNSFGWGIANVQHAIESLNLTGSLLGTVTASADGSPLAGAIVTVYPMTGTAAISSTVADGSGQYRFGLTWGSYRVEAAVDGYDGGSAGPVYLVGGKATSVSLTLARVPVVGDLRVSAGDNASVVLAWAQVAGADHYEVWRSAAAYFAPGSADATWLGDVGQPGGVGAVSFTDATAIEGPDPAYFYVVRVVSLAGGKSFVSNRVGEFTYSITAGESSP